MGKCKFNLKVDVIGADVEKYSIVKLGGKYAKIKKVYDEDDRYVLTLESRHKNRDFIMFIETIWTISKRRKTFEIISNVVSIDLFGIDWTIYVIPDSHINTLKKWYAELYE